MSKPRVILWLAVAALAGGAFYVVKERMAPAGAPAHGGAPAQTVAAQPAQMQTWQPTMELVGDLRASEGADLSLQVSGIVESLAFESGQTVQAGTPLLQLVAEDQVAKLASLKATAELNAIILKRDTEQLKIKAVSQATVDTDEANLKNSQALVKQQEALVSYYALKAPFTGRLGIRNVDLGQYLSAGTAIVTLQALDPLFADFFVPQKFFGQLKVGEPVKVTVDAYPGQSFPGTVSAINAKVESGSRNVKVRATLKNPDGKLVPGMFAKVALDVGAAERFVTLPQTAIVANPYGSTVFVLEKTPDGKGLVARETFVKLGQARGDFIAVTSGLSEGETVVVAGQIKLRNGTPAVVDNSHIPKVELDPNVSD
ncbi:efflux RND transporter periplasmic adaptor subunit [Ancylobacter vacuolatus]|uniref:Membrane fusion protein (Multidrug efflux system) n=1 Tax=Ancylobacter vacuolatus TaxID=223389 RepID=A0ABU0DE54_9HYPH|nr:efflux RND transporter periplasmic adaptor subunit [Ancylobacter vacuolatus]MDQ0346698.1 membrane fusion protein (multidrug efflux system) [Ancylobacter vacuolatus]